jgi:hypothetical protein
MNPIIRTRTRHLVTRTPTRDNMYNTHISQNASAKIYTAHICKKFSPYIMACYGDLFVIMLKELTRRIKYFIGGIS